MQEVEEKAVMNEKEREQVGDEKVLEEEEGQFVGC